MTDKEKVAKLLIELGIPFEEGEYCGIEITVEGPHEIVRGYFGFFAGFVFDASSKFLHMHIAE